jgi:hemolysin activation/secretion protein
MRLILVVAGCLLCAAISEAQQIDLPPLATQPGKALSDADTFIVHRFAFSGNTVFTDSQLRRIVSGYIGRQISSDDLENARRKLTEVYVNSGYITSGVVVPDQDVSGGTVRFQIIEGKLRRQSIELSREDTPARRFYFALRDSYIVDRIIGGAGRVLNIVNLKQSLDLLRQNPNIKRINAELEPGAAPGDSHLDVRVAENQPYHLSIDFNNRRPPSVGAEEFTAHAWTTNLTGNSDSLTMDYTAFTGDFQEQQFSNLDNFGADYALPLNASDTTLDVSFSRTNSPVIENPFASLDIKSDTQSTALTLTQPLVRNTTEQFDTVDFSLFVSGSFRQNKTTLLGESFTFSPGAVNGTSRVTAIRFGPELDIRNQQQAISLRSTFSVGVDALGATIHGDDVPDSQFVDWLGQFQYVRRLFDTDNQLIFRTAAQISDSPLLSLEQFSLGGFDTVRGYRENEAVRDDAIASTLEFHIPFPGIPRHEGVSILDLAPFADIGYAQNLPGTSGGAAPKFLSSLGVGLLFHPNEHLDMQIYYGYPLENEHLTSDLQDIGIHFDVLVTAF